MAIRKGHKVNIKASTRTTASDSIFLDIKDGTTVRVRFLPPATPDGALFTKVVNHFQLQTDDSPPRGMAVACTHHFKDEECYMCDLSKALKEHGDKKGKDIGDDIRASANFYAPVLVAEKMDDGKLEYFGPKLVRLPKTAVESITSILVQQDAAGDAFFCDIEKGQDVTIHRTGVKYQTKYSVMPTGVKANLDKTCPDWEDKYIDDVLGACSLKFMTNAEMEEAAKRTFGDSIDWAAIEE